ncbi:MAG TPA: hypothetical protein VKR32_17990, partial [Puia sp.]|nr:hypothetical protein [Puia sp.]
MNKKIFLIWVAIFCYSASWCQDSCFEFPVLPDNIINNPSFELDPGTPCRSGYLNQQNLIVPYWNTPTNEVLTGYLNACTNFIVPNDSIVSESYNNVYMYLFPTVPQPIPDGNGVVAVADFGYEGNTHEYPFRKSYVSTCLTNVLQKDSLYRLDFYVGFGDMFPDTLAVNAAELVPEQPLNAEKFTLFGYQDCSNNNVPIIGCPAVSGWTPLGSVVVKKHGPWQKVNIRFRATDNF